MSGFILFDRKAAASAKGPVATVQKSGNIGLNAAAHQMLDETEFVEFLYDPSRKVLALRPAEDSVNSYKIREPSSTGYTSVFAAAVFDAYDIDYTESRRHTPWLEGNMLCLDVGDASTDAVHKTTEGDSSQ